MSLQLALKKKVFISQSKVSDFIKGGSPCKRLKIGHILKMFLKVIKSFYCFKFLT